MIIGLDIGAVSLKLAAIGSAADEPAFRSLQEKSNVFFCKPFPGHTHYANRRLLLSRYRRIVQATPTHSWILADGQRTDSLSPGEFVAAMRTTARRENESHRLVGLHGLVFGDGDWTKQEHHPAGELHRLDAGEAERARDRAGGGAPFVRPNTMSLSRLFDRRVLLSLLLLVAVANEPAFAAAGDPAAATPWWVWPLALFVVCFFLGIVAVPAGVGGGVLFVPIVGGFFPFHPDFVRGGGLMVALASALAASPSLLRLGPASLRRDLPLSVLVAIRPIPGPTTANARSSGTTWRPGTRPERSWWMPAPLPNTPMATSPARGTFLSMNSANAATSSPRPRSSPTARPASGHTPPPHCSTRTGSRPPT